jgi:large subunit ribosomal protein L3
MSIGLLGTKIGMTRILGDAGTMEPATIVKAGPCVVLQVKSSDGSDRYNAVQLGFGDVKPHRSTMPMIGHAGKAGVGPKRHIREFRLEKAAEVNQGDVLTVQRFADEEITYVDVTGVSKGKGFQGVMKRYGFGGQPASHGTERKHRSAGGIGAHAPRGTAQSVKKGKRMSGHMGHVRRTAVSLRLLKVDSENDLLIIRGSVPGPNGGMVIVKRAKKRK